MTLGLQPPLCQTARSVYFSNALHFYATAPGTAVLGKRPIAPGAALNALYTPAGGGMSGLLSNSLACSTVKRPAKTPGPMRSRIDAMQCPADTWQLRWGACKEANREGRKSSKNGLKPCAGQMCANQRWPCDQVFEQGTVRVTLHHNVAVMLAMVAETLRLTAQRTHLHVLHSANSHLPACPCALLSEAAA